MGAAGPGASGSTLMSVYLVVLGSKFFSAVMAKFGAFKVSRNYIRWNPITWSSALVATYRPC